MKRIVIFILAILILGSSFSAAAAGAGSASDPLVTKSYAVDTYLSSIIEKSASDVTKALAAKYEASAKTADDIYDAALVRLGRFSGYTLSKSYVRYSVKSGASAKLVTGASLILVSGSATVTVTSGLVINVATGETVESGQTIKAMQRYFCAESTAAVFTAASDSVFNIDGMHRYESNADEPDMSFSDVKSGDWFYDAVSFVYSRGLFKGTSDTEFSPESSMTRAMFVTVLYRLDGKPAGYSSGSVFSDVTDSGQYYYEPVVWASKNGIVNGYEDSTYRPDASITREQMALIIYNYVKYRGISVAGVSAERFNSFPDAKSVQSWAREALIWAADRRIINGSDGRILPADTATRAQVAQIIVNCFNSIPGL